MKYVHWTLDLQEAEIVAGLLRAEGMPAWVLNAGQTGINWLHILALGGFRVYVPCACLQHAMQVMLQWRDGAYALDDEDDVCCPHCASTQQFADQLTRALSIVISLVFALPAWWPRRRLRCAGCGKRWKFRKRSFASLVPPAFNTHGSADVRT